MTDAFDYGALTLAYIGDTVYETYNRENMIKKGDRKVTDLHRLCSNRAKAPTQMKMAEILSEKFTEKESAVFHRGRNAEVHTKAKNATTQEYHMATGLEAVIGYLYLSGKKERAFELIDYAWEKLGIS